MACRGALPRQALPMAVSSQTWFGGPSHPPTIPQSRVACMLMSTTIVYSSMAPVFIYISHIYIYVNIYSQEQSYAQQTPVASRSFQTSPSSRSDGFLSSDRLKSPTWVLAALKDFRKLSPSPGRVCPVVLKSQCQQLFVTFAPADGSPGLLFSLATRIHIKHQQDSRGLMLSRSLQWLPKG